MNYGSLGLLISQQMIKVYDSEGRLYDDSGVRGKRDALTQNNYENYIQCYEKQIKDLDDIFTEMADRDRYQFIGQLITDKTMFRQTILAYRAYSQQSSPEICLVGLNHTAEQLFWIHSANTFLNTYENADNSYDIINYRLESIFVLDDSISYLFSRINSVLSNIKEFSEAFNCSSVSTMKSPIKC